MAMLKLQVSLGLECWMVHSFCHLHAKCPTSEFLVSGIILSIHASPMVPLTSKYMMR